MSETMSANRRSIAILAGTMLASVGLAVGMRMSGLHLPLAGRLVVAAVVVAAGAWAACGYWRTVDEAGREAQKWAWFWGSSVGIAVGAVILLLIANTPGLIAESRPGWLMLYGAGVILGGQTIGFLAAWAYWWARRR